MRLYLTAHENENAMAETSAPLDRNCPRGGLGRPDRVTPVPSWANVLKYRMHAQATAIALTGPWPSCCSIVSHKKPYSTDTSQRLVGASLSDGST
jgi:hypothetical protein